MAIDDTHPYLYLFALSIPEVWAFISFGTFFADVSVIVWQSPKKGWIVKLGTLGATTVLVSHLIAFALLFRQQGSLDIHPPPPPNPILTPRSPSPLSKPPNEMQYVNENLGRALTMVNSEILVAANTSPFTTPSYSTNVPPDTLHPNSSSTCRPSA